MTIAMASTQIRRCVGLALSVASIALATAAHCSELMGSLPRHPDRKRPAEACAQAAATYHRVNAHMLTAILRVENMREDQVVLNTNGSVDIGHGGINSVHLPELARWGVGPADLKDGCKNVYIAAWLVSRHLRRHGNTWAAYAAYHSTTPHLNTRYQILLANELVRMGVMPGPLRPVPALIALVTQR